MDRSYQQAPVFSGHLQAPFTAHRPPPSSGAPPPTQPDHTAAPWAPSPAYDGTSYGLGCDFPAAAPGGVGFGGPRFAPPYGFDPSTPPPPFGCPPPGQFPGYAPPAPVNAYPTFQTFSPQFGAGPPRYDCSQNPYEELREGGGGGGGGGGGPGGPTHLRQDREPGPGTSATTQPEDERSLQRRQDAQWIGQFLKSRGKASRSPQTRQQQRSPLSSIPALREALYGAVRLVSRLEELCHSLKHNLHHDTAWTDSYSAALRVKRQLQDSAELIGDTEGLDRLKFKVSRVARRRSRRLRAGREQQVEEEHDEELRADKEAAIDKWRMKQIQQVEEKKKEQELKLAADSVLCEVRKKQADVKRMQDVLRSLEKLRRLRKEAASRKGIVTRQQCDEEFGAGLEQLRAVTRRRTAVYSAEEKALMVMLEGEQEEERRRERERRAKKEAERRLQRRRRVDAMLFGEELPADCILQPFTEYYSQAEHSLHAVVRIRRDWDMFVVAADHPEGSSVPQSWILPDPPSDQTWASALQTCDSL